MQHPLYCYQKKTPIFRRNEWAETEKIETLIELVLEAHVIKISVVDFAIERIVL